MSKYLVLSLCLSAFLYANTNDNTKAGWYFYKDPKENQETKQEQEIKKEVEKNKKEVEKEIEKFDIPIDKLLKETKEQREKRKKEEELFMRSIPLNSLDSMSAGEYRETFLKARDIAVMNPSKENVYVVQFMNSWHTQRSKFFSEVWGINLLEDPNNLSSTDPNGSLTAQTKHAETDRKTKEFFEKNKDKIAYVIFHNPSQIELNNEQEKVFKLFQETYGIAYEFIDLSHNYELAQRLKVAATPDSFMVYKSSKGEAIWKRVGFGLVPQATLEQNTILTYNTLILEKDK